MNKFSQQTVAIHAACVGKGLAFDMVREVAILGADTLQIQADEFREYTATKYADEFGLKASASLSKMQADKVPGVGTFYTYFVGLRAFYVKGKQVTRKLYKNSKGEMGEFTLETITPTVLTSQSKWAKVAGEPDAPASTDAPTGASTDAPTGAAPTGPVLTLPTILAALETLHASGMIDGPAYERIAGIRPVVKVTPMADVVELKITA